MLLSFLTRSLGRARCLLLAAPILGPITCELPPRNLHLPQAVVRPDRSAHLLDRPYPSDELRTAEGRITLQGFPRPGPQVGRGFMAAWIAQATATVNGFSALTPIYFRFEAPPALAASYPGRPDDPVRLLSLDSDHHVRVRVRFVQDSLGDPYLRTGTLVVSPDETDPLRPGERYVALVTGKVARPADFWTPPDELDARSLRDHAVATIFTVADSVGQLRALRDAADALLDASPLLLQPGAGLREVASLRYEPGTTASGALATLETVTFVDGTTEVTELNDSRFAARSIDLSSGPLRVFQADIHTAAFQDPEGRPYQSPGIGIVLDLGRTDGWIDFAPDDSLRTAPHPEPMRVVVQVPRAGCLRGLLRWGHGSGGDAYEAVERVDPANDLASLRARIAAQGTVIVSFDQPLFGQRFPLIDLGYEPTLAIVNIPNLPAFRDGVRQGAVDAHVVSRFAREVLPSLVPGLPEGPLGPPLAAFGHSIGAQIAGVGIGLERAGHLTGLLLNGTGGFETHSVLASDLLRIQGTVGELIFQLAGIPPRPGARPNEILGALFGVPEAAWPGIDRHHPLALAFQLILDAGDPLPVAPFHDTPVRVLYGDGDSFVPPDGAAWIAGAARIGELVPCHPSTAYDGHYCVFREEAGRAAFDALLSVH